jgi:hypothetical protein
MPVAEIETDLVEGLLSGSSYRNAPVLSVVVF